MVDKTDDGDRIRRMYCTDTITTHNLTVVSTLQYSALSYSTTGATTTGFTVAGANTNGILFSSTATYGIYIPTATACTNAVKIGDSTTAGMPVNATSNKLVVIYGTIPTGATTNTSNLRCIWGRLGITAAAVLTGGGAQAAGHFTTMVYGGTTTTLGSWATAGLYGSLGIDGVSTTTLSTGAYACGVLAEFKVSSTNYTCSSGAHTSGLYVVMSAPTGVTMTGTYSGIYIENQGTAALASAFAIDPTNTTNFLTLGSASGFVSAAASITTVGYKLAVNLVGVGTVYIPVATAMG